MNQMTFNIRHMFIITTGTQQKAKPMIDKLFKEREQEYYELYLNSEMYEDTIKEMFTIPCIETINKLIGIVEYSYNNNSFLLLEQIAKEIHPSIIKYVKKKPTVNIQDFFYSYVNIKEASEQDLYSIMVCLVYFSVLYKKEVMGNEAFYLGWKLYLDSAMKHARVNEIPEKNKPMIDKMYEWLHISKEQTFPMKFDNIFDFLVDSEIIEMLQLPDHKSLTTLSSSVYQSYRDKVFKQGLSKHIGVCSGMFSAFGLDTNTIFNRIISKEYLDSILNQCVNYYKANNLTEEELKGFMIHSLFMVNLLYLYDEVKDLYLKKSKDDYFHELKSFETRLKEEKHTLDVEHKTYQSKLTELEKEKKALSLQVKGLQSELANLTSLYKKEQQETLALNEELLSYKREMEALRTSYEKAHRLEDEATISLEEMVAQLNEYKIALFGGHNTTKSKLATSIPTILMFDNKTEDISSIKKADYVFINTDWFSHAFSEKVLSYCKKNQIPFFYIGGTNYENVITMMYAQLENKEI